MTDTISDARTFPFFQVENALIDKFGAVLGPYGIAVYVCIVRHFNQKVGAAWPSMATIASETGMSRRRVITAVKQLEKLGLLRVEPRYHESGGKTSHHYMLVNVEPLTPPQTPVDPPSTPTEAPPCESGAHTHVHDDHIPCVPGAHEEYESNKTKKKDSPDADAPEAPTPIQEPAEQERTPAQQENDAYFDAVLENAFSGVRRGNGGRIGVLVKAIRAEGYTVAQYEAACAAYRKEGLTVPRGEGTTLTMLKERAANADRPTPTVTRYLDGSTRADALAAAEAYMRELEAA